MTVEVLEGVEIVPCPVVTTPPAGPATVMPGATTNPHVVPMISASDLWAEPSALEGVLRVILVGLRLVRSEVHAETEIGLNVFTVWIVVGERLGHVHSHEHLVRH